MNYWSISQDCLNYKTESLTRYFQAAYKVVLFNNLHYTLDNYN